MTTEDRKLEITTKLAFNYRRKALYFCCLAKRRTRPQYECCQKCTLDTENDTFCDLVQYEIDCMTNRKEDEPKEQKVLGNDKLGKPKKKRPHKKPRNSSKVKR